MSTHAQEKKKKSGSLLVLTGTAAGDVKAYNTQLGELVWRVPNCIEGCVDVGGERGIQRESGVNHSLGLHAIA